MTSTLQQKGRDLKHTTSKPQSRRPTLVRKQDDADLAFDQGEASPSSSKRIKVSFDDEVEVNIIDELEKAPEIIREEVRHALEGHLVGDNTGYERIKAMYKATGDDAPSITTLRLHTAALIPHVTSLNRSYSGLVYAIVRSNWLGREENYVALFLRFLGSLISAQGSYLRDVLGMLIDNLTSSEFVVGHSCCASANVLQEPPSHGQLPNQPSVTRPQIYRRTHAALKYLLQLVPSASGTLSDALAKTFPPESDSGRAHSVFVQNLLNIIDYAPELQSEILSLITERLVKMDVQVQVDIEALAEDVGEDVVQGIPRLQTSFTEDLLNADDEESDEESVSGDDELDPENQKAKNITGNVEKLDLVLDILFSYYEPHFSGTSSMGRDSALNILLSQFTTIILPAYRSRHIQFLLFHFAQTSPELIDNFVGACVHIAFDKGRASIFCQSAAAYLASFVARGMRVPSQIVRDVFDYIGGQLNTLLAGYEPTCRGPDLRRYSTYYSLFQALLYIFCFRWRDLEADADESPRDEYESLQLIDEYDPSHHRWIPGIKETFSQNIFSKLNPLKVCSPPIVLEFARIAKHLGLMYVFHLLETNKRIRLTQVGSMGSTSRHPVAAYSLPERQTALSGRHDESVYQLDGYFPFDPYHLPRSQRWIEGDYQEWRSLPGLDGGGKGGDEEDESDSGGEEQEEEGSDVDEDTETDEGDGS